MRANCHFHTQKRKKKILQTFSLAQTFTHYPKMLARPWAPGRHGDILSSDVPVNADSLAYNTQLKGENIPTD